jgi:seryl-tRNA synthetase
MERALAAFMLDRADGRDTGTPKHAAPLFGERPALMFGTGQLPKFVNDLFSAPPSEARCEPPGIAERPSCWLRFRRQSLKFSGGWQVEANRLT